jgi:NAD-dependent deacetylase
MLEAKPNTGHLAVADLVARGKVAAIITQNIDNLHQDSGVSADQVIELHGNATYAKCLDCSRRFEMETVEREFRESNGVGGTDKLKR